MSGGHFKIVDISDFSTKKVDLRDFSIFFKKKCQNFPLFSNKFDIVKNVDPPPGGVGGSSEKT